MAQSSISKSIRKLYHIKNDDLQDILEELPDDTLITIDTLKPGNYPWEADDVFYDYGITTLYELSNFLSSNGTLHDIIEVTKGSTSQYEADFRLNKFFEDYFENNPVDDIQEEDIDEFFIEQVEQAIFDHLGIEEHDNDTDPLIISMEKNERMRYSTVLNIMDPQVYHPAKVEAFTGTVWGVSSNDEIVLDYDETMLSEFMDQIPDNHTHGIITLAAMNDSFVGDVSFEIDYDNNTVVFHNAIIPSILEHPLIVQNYIITLRVFNDNETIDVIKPGGGTLTVPRKYVASWISINGDHFHGVSAEDLSSAHSFDYRTGELLVPEEGVDFISTGCITIVEEDIMMNQEDFDNEFYDESENGYFD